jgi:hypothetical protein
MGILQLMNQEFPINSIIELFFFMINRLWIFAVVLFFLTRFLGVKKCLNESRYKTIALSIVFGSFGIAGTLTGLPIQNAIANSRVVGVVLGGILGGQWVGLYAGIIAGGFRLLYGFQSFAAGPCCIATIVEGCLGNILYHRINHERKEFDAIAALITGLICEILHMLIILALAKPFQNALNLVKVIAMPMIIVNSVGIFMFVEMLSWVSKVEAFDSLRFPNSKDRTTDSPKEFKIFLASSNSLKNERNAINNFITAKDKYLRGKGPSLKLVMWEKDITLCLCPEPIQNKFNEEMLRCDMVIVLFFDRVGQFTREEFDKAYVSLKDGGNPIYLYVFFKQDWVKIDDISWEEVKKIQELKDRIKREQQIYCTYTSIDNLLSQIWDQMKLILKAQYGFQSATPEARRGEA